MVFSNEIQNSIDADSKARERICKVRDNIFTLHADNINVRLQLPLQHSLVEYLHQPSWFKCVVPRTYIIQSLGVSTLS